MKISATVTQMCSDGTYCDAMELTMEGLVVSITVAAVLRRAAEETIIALLGLAADVTGYTGIGQAAEATALKLAANAIE